MRCLAVLAAMIAVAAAPAPAASAGPCQRTVGIGPQESGGEGAGRIAFAVWSAGCGAASDVGYEITESIGGSAEAGADFKPQVGRLRFEAGSLRDVTIAALIVQDAVREADLEDFVVRLLAPGPDVLIHSANAQARIIDDDGRQLAWAIDDGSCPELPDTCLCPSETGEIMPNVPMCITERVTLSAPTSEPVTFEWSTLDGSARADWDYVAVDDGQGTIAAGSTSARLTVRLLPRPPGTPKRWFYVRLTAVSAGTIADGIAVFTIGGP